MVDFILKYFVIIDYKHIYVVLHNHLKISRSQGV